MMSSKCTDLPVKAPGTGPCSRRLWVFLVLGAVDIVLGLISVGLYFNIQAITTSDSLTEVIPGYIVCLVVLLKGSIVLVLFWLRPSCLIFVCLAVATGCGLLCVVLAILCVTHVLQPITNLDSCTYVKQESVCECKSSYRRDGLTVEFLPAEKDKIKFERSNSCDDIESLLPVLLYAECALYLCIFIVCTIVAVLSFLIIKLEKRNILRNETYEEIFTVSGGSSCSESEGEPEADSTPASEGYTGPERPEVNSQLVGRNTCPPGILKNQDKHEILVDKSLSRSKSCDSIDLIYNASESDKVKKGRLKEHRRRERRAVTLNNLDSKQLLLILDLQRRYQEETRLLKSQGNLNITPTGATPSTELIVQRRAVTPQPYRKPNPNTLPRSHTPQPGPVSGCNIRMGELARDLQNCLRDRESATQNKEPQRKTDGSEDKKLVPQNDGYVHMAPRPKSRPSVQKYFLPPQPIQRCRSTSPFTNPRQRKTSPSEQLPSQPKSRTLDPTTLLPPAPIQRNGSAFQLVGHPVGPMYNKGSVSHDVVFRTPGDVFCENAIRDNFKLYSSPFLLRNTKQGPVDSVSGSTLTPPYSGPPSYTEFLSRTDSALESGSEHIYETYENISETKSSSRKVSSPKRSPKKTSENVQTTESEDDVFLPVKASTSIANSSPSQPYIPAYNDSSRRRKPKKRSGRQKQAANDIAVFNSHVSPFKTTTESPDFIQHQSPSENDNVYAISAKARTKSANTDTECESSRKLNTNNFSKMPCNSVSASEEKVDGKQLLENETSCTKTGRYHTGYIIGVRGYSKRMSESSGCTYEDVEESSIGVSSQASLISSSDEITREFNRAIDEIHPGLGDPRVLETMI
ncbi:uncharacterized protein LOC134281860 [Saccostrea cucullata]|uniref:uncharacterized protein LOC134281860 n=1 Tax=Saccostrea cuccullata TaxID=36930 RepID=UPI002ED2C2DC